MKINELISKLNKSYLEIKEESKLMQDTLRNKPRIEIPAAFVISLLNEGNKKSAKKLLDLLLDKQTVQGYFFEYSYEKEEEPVGYYGAVPTCFCIFALLKGYEELRDEKYLHAAIKACDYLYSKEKSGYFYKATQNKSDVINTNLLCALALMDTIEAMSQKSRRTNAFRGAAVRAIRRSLNSQKINGAFPYTSYGLTVPFLYHSMSVALLTNLSYYFKDSYLSFSIRKGLRYLKKISNKDGSINWKKEKFEDKSGSCWVYAWNYNLYDSLSIVNQRDLAERNLNRLLGKNFMKEGDMSKDEDLFYTSWSILAISLSRSVNIKRGGVLRFYSAKIKKIPKIVSLTLKIVERKLFSYGLDKGPVEYW